VNQYRCITGTNQQWQFQDQGGGYYRLAPNQQFERRTA
jgi:hypothetical protein